MQKSLRTTLLKLCKWINKKKERLTSVLVSNPQYELTVVFPLKKARLISGAICSSFNSDKIKAVKVSVVRFKSIYRLCLHYSC